MPWLSNDFVEKVLQDFHEDPSIHVDKMLIRLCSAKGDNYASSMYRMHVEFNSDKLVSLNFFCYKKLLTILFNQSQGASQASLIIKTMCQNELALEKLGADNYDVQRKEMDMYFRVLPAIKKILKSIGEDTNIFPNTMSIDEANDIIIMEDLMEKNYVMPNRVKRLDLVHVKMAMRKLALFHAASIVMHEENPKVFDNFDTGMFNRKTNALQIFFKTNFEAFCDLVSQWDDHQYYADKLNKLRPHFCENAMRAFDCDEGDLAALCHGDFWTNNTLFSYDKNMNPLDVIIVSSEE